MTLSLVDVGIGRRLEENQSFLLNFNQEFQVRGAELVIVGF